MIRNSNDLNGFETNNFIHILSTAVENGESIMFENVGETFDPIIDALIGRNAIKRGRRSLILIGDHEVECHPKFKLFLRTKLANPQVKL
jgi:dynein heavy chain